MKVLHFIASIDKSSGGTSVYLELLTSELAKYVDLKILSGKSPNPIILQSIDVSFIDIKLRRWFRLRKEYKEYLLKECPDIVHINGIWMPQIWLFQKVAEELGFKVVLSTHGMLDPYILSRNPLKKKIALWFYQNQTLNSTKFFHVTSQLEYDSLVRFGISSVIKIVPNAVDLSKIKRKIYWNTEITLPKRLLYLSRIHSQKGIELLIDALSLVKGNFVMTIAGQGNHEYIDFLERKIVEKGLKSKIEFVGGVYGDTKWEYFNKSDIFILPSYSECFGIVVAEAMAVGLPVITTKGTPWEELIDHNCGWWIDLSIENLKEAIEDALSKNCDELKLMGYNGNSLITEKYNTINVSKQMFYYYNNILNVNELNEKIKKDDLYFKVNSNIKNILKSENYEIHKVKSIELLTSERFDIIAKYIFVKYYMEEIDCDYGEELYAEHIRVFNNFVENDSSNKVGKLDFIKSFKKLIDSIEEYGFKSDSIIPINYSNIVLDGSHRVAIAIYKNIEINSVNLSYSNSNFKFDYDFFRERGLSQNFLDLMSFEYAKLKSNTKVILVWPRAVSKDDELLDILQKNGKIVAHKKVKLSLSGLVNLITYVYKDEPWLGNYKNDFTGARTKAQLCYNPENQLRVYLYQSDSDLITIKEKIRNLFEIEKHAVHINDTHGETIELCQLLFNANSINYLNFSQLSYLDVFENLFNKYKNWLLKSKRNVESYALIGGVLSVYGISQSNDLDFICSADNKDDLYEPNIEREINKLNYTKLSVSQLIYNPDNYFYYKGLKTISLNVIYDIKKNRGNPSDIKAIDTIERLMNNKLYYINFKSSLNDFFSINFYLRRMKLLMLRLRYYYFLVRKKL